jgi:signal transduction histidine kinase
MERISAGRVEGGEALAGYHRAIEHENSRLDTLVTRLLETQAIQRGLGEAPRRAGPIEPLLRAALDECRHHAESKGIALELTVDPGLPDLLIDGPRVTDAVLNLVENALKYSPSSSRVSVTARAAGGEVQVTVSDQGAGIHKDDLPRIFEPYYRGRLGDRESVRGTGLGLALVQATAAAHGGRVEVASGPGRGSRFTLCLPIEGGT